jgi:hypothetical protein
MRSGRGGLEPGPPVRVDDPFAGLEQLAERLETLQPGRHQAEPAQVERLAQIELSARRCYRDATRRYLHALRGQPDERLEHWGEIVEVALMRLAHAHQALAIPWTRRRLRSLRAEDAPVVIAGAIRTCAAILKWRCLRGAPEPVGVWGDICRLFALAEARGCTRTAVAATPETGLGSSAEREFLKACMLAVAEPASMPARQLDIAERAMEFCSAGFALSGAADARFPHLIDLEGGEPPYARAAGTPLRPSLRSFGAAGAEQLLAALLRLVQTDRIPPRAFGAEVDKAEAVAALSRLQNRWLPPAAHAGGYSAAAADAAVAA